MPRRFEPRIDVLPEAQRLLWPQLAPTRLLSFVLYGGTAIALRLAHRESVDFDFFRHEPLIKAELHRTLPFLREVSILQDEPDTLVGLAKTESAPVRVSFFGRMRFGRVNDPTLTQDGVLLVASLDDLMATKLKAILDRAEAKDYRDIAEMLQAGVSLARGLSAFRQMFGGEPATVLRAIGYFADGNLATLGEADRRILTQARDRVGDLPSVKIRKGNLSGE